MAGEGDYNNGDGSSSSSSDEEKLRKLLKPNTKAEHVIEAVKDHFIPTENKEKAIITVAKELESYDDRNYLVEIQQTESSKPQKFLVKVHNGVESADFVRLSKENKQQESVIHLQNAMMEHLCSHGVVTSRPQRPQQQQQQQQETDSPAIVRDLPVVSDKHSPCPLVVRLLQWVPGTPMSSLKMLPIESLADAGKFLGRLHAKMDLLDNTQLKAARRFHQWDGKNTLELKSFVPCIPDKNRQAMILSILDAFQKELIDSGISKSFRQGLIHADFNDANIVMDENLCVSGVIDFGDSVYSWRVLDVSVAMAYAMLTVYAKPNRSISAAAALLRGYHSIHPLTELERRHLLLLIACRLACSVTLGAYSYQQNPENEYLLLHATPAWDVLNMIWGTNEIKRQEELAPIINGFFNVACDEINVEKNGKQQQQDDNKEKETNNDSDNVIIDCSDLCFPNPNISDPLVSVRMVKAQSDNNNDEANNRPAKRRKSH